MFDIGWSEILVIVIITILVVGPKELPGLLRTIGKTVGNLRRMAGDFQSQFNDALKEAELDEVKNTIGDIRKLDPTTAVKDAVKKQVLSVDDLTEDLSGQMKQSTDEINETLTADNAASNSEVADLLEDEAFAQPVVAEAAESVDPVEQAPVEAPTPAEATEAPSKDDASQKAD